MLPRWTIGLLALMLTVPPTHLLAQGRGPGPGAMPTDSLVATYASRLNLTDEQTGQIRTILESHVAKARKMVEDARAEGPEAMQDLRSEMMRMREEASQEVEKVLTEEQIPEYRKIQAEIRERMQDRMRQGRQQPPPSGR